MGLKNPFRLKSDSAECAARMAKLSLARQAIRNAVAESLEQRTLLSTYTVTSLADSGANTLRAAVVAANGDTTNTPIQIQFNLPTDPATINLSSGLELSNTAEPVTIDGPGEGGLLITGATGSLGSLIAVDYGVSASITGVTLGSTSASSGVLSNSGTLNVTDSTISNNSNGSGITNGGSLSITDSTVSGNAAQFSGGGLYLDGTTITITDSYITNNAAGYGGAGIYSDAQSLTITNSTISGNHATAPTGSSIVTAGGGVWLGDGDDLSITGSTIDNNSAQNGAGIEARSGQLTLSQSTLSGNTDGGAITSYGTLNLYYTSVNDNTAGAKTRYAYPAGGITNFGSLTISQSTISDNTTSGTGAGGVETLNPGMSRAWR